MRTIQHIVSAALAAGLFIACGCRTSGPHPVSPSASPIPGASSGTNAPAKSAAAKQDSKPSKSPKAAKSAKSAKLWARKPSAPEADPTQIDDRELERRVKAHAAFAAGVLSQIKEEPEAALEYFERASLSDPANEGLAIDVARRRLQRLEFDKAIALLKKAAAVPGSSGTVMAYLGLTLKQLDRPAEAIAAYREALRRMPSSLASAG